MAATLTALHLRVTDPIRRKLDTLAAGSGITRSAAARIVLARALNDIDDTLTTEETHRGQDQ